MRFGGEVSGPSSICSGVGNSATAAQGPLHMGFLAPWKVVCETVQVDHGRAQGAPIISQPSEEALFAVFGMSPLRHDRPLRHGGQSAEPCRRETPEAHGTQGPSPDLRTLPRLALRQRRLPATSGRSSPDYVLLPQFRESVFVQPRTQGILVESKRDSRPTRSTTTTASGFIRSTSETGARESPHRAPIRNRRKTARPS